MNLESSRKILESNNKFHEVPSSWSRVVPRKQAGRQAGRQADRQTDRQTDIQTDRQTDRQI